MIRILVVLLWNLLQNLVLLPRNLVRLLRLPPQGAYVHLTLKNHLPRYQDLSWFQRIRRRSALEPTLEDLHKLLEAIKHSKRIAGILVQFQELECSWTEMEEFRDDLLSLKEAGKEVVLFPAEALSLQEYYLASAGKIVLSPATSVVLTSPSMQLTFFRQLLDKVGVEPGLERVGEHKNAPESLMETEPSPTHRQDIESLLEQLRQLLFDPIAQQRNTSSSDLQQLIDRGIFSFEEALDKGLVEAIRFQDRLARYLQDKDPTPFQPPEALLSPKKEEQPPDESLTESVADSLKEKTGQEELPLAESVADSLKEKTGQEELPSPLFEVLHDATEALVDKAAPEKTSAEEATPNAKESTEEAKEAAPDAEEASPPLFEEKVKELQDKLPDDKVNDNKEEDEEEEDELLLDADEFRGRRLLSFRWTPLRRPAQIAVIPVEGVIREGTSLSRGPAGSMAGSETIVSALEEALESPRIKGVLLHIDSRGGSGMASEEIWRAVRRVDQEKPVVAFLDSYAASGGYYVACAARIILASPWTLTGSIGVFGGKIVYRELLERVGLSVTEIGTTPGVQIFSPLHPLDDEGRERIRLELERFYQRFLDRVVQGRNIPLQQLKPLAEGRVYLGKGALEKSLLDHCGSWNDALEKTRELADAPRAKPLRLGLPSGWDMFLEAAQSSSPSPFAGLTQLARSLLSPSLLPELFSLRQHRPLQQLTTEAHLVSQWLTAGRPVAWCGLALHPSAATTTMTQIS